MNILILGDVVGNAGCEHLRKVLPKFKKENNIDLCIVNGENSGNHNGITPSSAGSIFTSGADVITTGNHAFKRKEIYDYFDENPYIIRPANFSEEASGRGYCVVDMGHTQVAVINLMGVVYMDSIDNPFKVADDVLEQVKDCKIKIVDFHAEATAEKKCMGYYLDGRVTAVVGTHTHVQTSDEKVLEKGTAYITDLGMTGPTDSVLGVKKEQALYKMINKLPVMFETAEGDCEAQGIMLIVDVKTSKISQIKRVILK